MWMKIQDLACFLRKLFLASEDIGVCVFREGDGVFGEAAVSDIDVG